MHQLKSQVTKISRSRSPIRCPRVGTEQSRNPRFSRPSDQRSPNRRSSHCDSSERGQQSDHRIAVGHNVIGDLASDDQQIDTHRILIRLGEISFLVDDNRQLSTHQTEPQTKGIITPKNNNRQFLINRFALQLNDRCQILARHVPENH